MSNKQSKSALENLKMQAANEVGVNLVSGYNGDITARQAGSVGGMMVKKILPKVTQVYNRQRLPSLGGFYNITVNMYTGFIL